ncbi:MAG TPA: TIM-barrel domain-containing protein, partial [Longimicrobiales bacterium]
MTDRVSRREALKRLGAAGASCMFAGTIRSHERPIMIAGQPAEIAVYSLSPSTVRLTIRPLAGGKAAPLMATGALHREQLGKRAASESDAAELTRLRAGDLIIHYADAPAPLLRIETRGGQPVQQLRLDAAAPGMTFPLGTGPLLGLGEGGAQFDRRGAIDAMRNGQGARSTGPGAYSLATHGTRAPVQWLISTTAGWALFIHQPYGSFDLTGSDGSFMPNREALPMDLFVIASHDPKRIMREFAQIVGFAELPARWTLGYMQSHRTLAGPEEILGVARTFREKQLPCDALIYLGTDFCPSGWNTHNGEFTWHAGNFPDPRVMIDELHARHFRVIMHIVIEGRTLAGSVTDACTAEALPPGRTADGHWPPDRQVSCYWPAHRPLMDVGVDGWWPDQGDGFD